MSMRELEKQALADRVEAAMVEFKASKDNLKTKAEHQEKRKCSQCKKTYLGQANSDTCSDACRKRKSRG